MGAEEVIEKILADAKAEAGKIKEQAEEKEAAELSKLDEQLDEYKKQTDILAERQGKSKKLHLLAVARMDIAKELLGEKRRLLDEIFAQAGEQLRNLPDEEYRKLMTKLMLETGETGDEEVIIDDNETRIDQEFIKRINRELGPGYKGNLRLAGVRQNLGAGFILRRGKIKNNVSIDVLLAQARKELEIELAEELFGNLNSKSLVETQITEHEKQSTKCGIR